MPADVLVNRPSPLVTHVVLNDSDSTFKGKTGVPVWYKEKVSPAFVNHILPTPPPQKKKKKSDTGNDKKQIFPACASSALWRQLYVQKKMENSSKKAETETS